MDGGAYSDRAQHATILVLCGENIVSSTRVQSKHSRAVQASRFIPIYITEFLWLEKIQQFSVSILRGNLPSVRWMHSSRRGLQARPFRSFCPTRVVPKS